MGIIEENINFKRSLEREKEGDLFYEMANKVEEKDKLFRDAGNKYYEAATEMEFFKRGYITETESPDLGEIDQRIKQLYEKIADSWQKSAESSKDLYWQMNFWAAAGKIRFTIINLLSEEDLLEKPKKEEPYLKSFEGSSVFGKATICYRQAVYSAIYLGENLEEQHKVRQAAILYGIAGDFNCSVAEIHKIIPKENLFFDKNDKYEYLLYAGECYLKTAKLNEKIGIPSIIGKNRMLDNNSLDSVRNIFKYKDELSGLGYEYATDVERAKTIFSLIEKDCGDKLLKARAHAGLKEIQDFSSFIRLSNTLVYQDIGLFVENFRNLILIILGSNWKDYIPASFFEKNGKPNRKEDLIETDLDIADFPDIINENWNDKFKIHFKGIMHKEKILFYIKAMNDFYRVDVMHFKKEFGEADRTVFNMFILKFEGIFKKHGIIKLE